MLELLRTLQIGCLLLSVSSLVACKQVSTPSAEVEQVVYSASYSPCGRTQAKSTERRAAYSFTSQEPDADLTKIDFGARFYSAAQCRFLGVDPIEQAGESAFAYVHNHFLSAVDPDGRDPKYKRENGKLTVSLNLLVAHTRGWVWQDELQQIWEKSELVSQQAVKDFEENFHFRLSGPGEFKGELGVAALDFHASGASELETQLMFAVRRREPWSVEYYNQKKLVDADRILLDPFVDPGEAVWVGHGLVAIHDDFSKPEFNLALAKTLRIFLAGWPKREWRKVPVVRLGKSDDLYFIDVGSDRHFLGQEYSEKDLSGELNARKASVFDYVFGLGGRGRIERNKEGRLYVGDVQEAVLRALEVRETKGW